MYLQSLMETVIIQSLNALTCMYIFENSQHFFLSRKQQNTAYYGLALFMCITLHELKKKITQAFDPQVSFQGLLSLLRDFLKVLCEIIIEFFPCFPLLKSFIPAFVNEENHNVPAYLARVYAYLRNRLTSMEFQKSSTVCRAKNGL